MGAVGDGAVNALPAWFVLIFCVALFLLIAAFAVTGALQ